MIIPKILAPAGSPETLQAVLDCGADEVYIGGKAYSARQNATNFSIDEIKDATNRCHLYGAKLHVAVNTIIFDSQLKEFADYIQQLAMAGVDALIVQDLGALELIKKIVPTIELHASTQMTIHSVNGALLMRDLGFKRVVLSRELDRKTIEKICHLGIDTEVFVHGSLCMSVSGQCYLSSMIGSRSANRGLCGQPCRLPFSTNGNSDSRILSLKDNSLMEHVQELIDMGVTSLKIEGRMKRPEYAACAVSTLRTALSGQTPNMNMLRSIFSRDGFTDGYFTGIRENMFGIRTKDNVISAEEVIPKIRESYRKPFKVSKLKFCLTLDKDIPTTLTAIDETRSYSVYGEPPEIALNRPLDYNTAERQLSKLGGTIYEYGGLDFYSSGNLTISTSNLNELRRKLVSRIDCERINRNQPKVDICKDYSIDIPRSVGIESNRKIWIRLRRFEQLLDIDISTVDKIIMPLDAIVSHNKISQSLAIRLIVQPPRFIVDELDTIKNLSKVLTLGIHDLMCTNLAYIKIGKQLGYTLHGDYGLNIINSLAVDSLRALGCVDAIISFEAKLSQIERINTKIPLGVEVYGRLPLMLVRNCPIKNAIKCSRCNHTISDRTNRKFPVYCSNGYAEIFNAETLSMADRLNDIHGNVGYYILSFLDESSKKISEVLQNFTIGRKMGTTRGLYLRGIV